MDKNSTFEKRGRDAQFKKKDRERERAKSAEPSGTAKNKARKPVKQLSRATKAIAEAASAEAAKLLAEKDVDSDDGDESETSSDGYESTIDKAVELVADKKYLPQSLPAVPGYTVRVDEPVQVGLKYSDHGETLAAVAAARATMKAERSDPTTLVDDLLLRKGPDQRALADRGSTLFGGDAHVITLERIGGFQGACATIGRVLRHFVPQAVGIISDALKAAALCGAAAALHLLRRRLSVWEVFRRIPLGAAKAGFVLAAGLFAAKAVLGAMSLASQATPQTVVVCPAAVNHGLSVIGNSVQSLGLVTSSPESLFRTLHALNLPATTRPAAVCGSVLAVQEIYASWHETPLDFLLARVGGLMAGAGTRLGGWAGTFWQWYASFCTRSYNAGCRAQAAYVQWASQRPFVEQALLSATPGMVLLAMIHPSALTLSGWALVFWTLRHSYFVLGASALSLYITQRNGLSTLRQQWTRLMQRVSLLL